MSHLMYGKAISGFFSKWIPYEQKEKYWDNFWDVIVGIFNLPGRSYSDKFWYSARPKYMDETKIIKKSEELWEKRDQYDGYWKKDVMSELEYYRRSAKVKIFA